MFCFPWKYRYSEEQKKEWMHVRDGTGENFLNTTRPVKFKIYAGWLAGWPFFTEGLYSVFNKPNDKL